MLGWNVGSRLCRNRKKTTDRSAPFSFKDFMQRIFNTKVSTLAVFALIGILVGSIVSSFFDRHSSVSAADGFVSRSYQVTPADGLTPSGANEAASYSFRYNGSTWDRVYSNQELTILPSAARTATTSSADFTNYSNKGIQIILKVTVAVAGTGGLQAVIQGKDPVSGTYYNLTAAPTAVVATGFKVYELGPNSSTAGAGDITVRSAGILPRTFRVTVTAGDGTSYTYSIGAVLTN